MTGSLRFRRNETGEVDAPVTILPAAAEQIAKGLTLSSGAMGTSFEAPQFERSPISGFFGVHAEVCENKIWNF